MGFVTLLLTLLGWTVVPLLLRHLAEWVDPWTNNGWRYGASALFWMPVVLIASLRGTLPKGIWRSAIWPSIANAAGQSAFTAAHAMVDPGLVTFGLRTQLGFVAVGAFILFPTERAVIRSWRYLGGVALLVVGLAPVLFTGSAQANLPGVLVSVASGLGYGWYALAVRRCMAEYGAVESFAVICQYTALILIVVMLVLGRDHGAYVPSLPGREIGALAVAAFIGIALGHVFYYISIARLGVALTSGVLQVQPFLVAAASFWLFGERLTPAQWIGGGVAVGGAVLMLTAKGKQAA